jgi:hypothetical protein
MHLDVQRYIFFSNIILKHPKDVIKTLHEWIINKGNEQVENKKTTTNNRTM